MNRLDLIRQAVADELGDVYDLLAIRLMFPPDHPAMDIEQDIRDLYSYPERLESSYRDEWERIACRALFDQGFRDHWRSDEENLARYLTYLQDTAIPACIHQHIDLFRMLGEVLAIRDSSRTLQFPSPQRRALFRLIWPESGGK
ncbi:MAG: hypothetical protein R3280_03865 [Marinobacter sp.]|uniref:hypothetical protein n=1 Tax=Marinobacter sp. TaxID=50741 RepID=UPI00299EAA8C|nr:hypothetical protein [Marinobacter sp.]MDX1633747.1 hypothetical protein [Marinobacter sp.]